MRRSLSVPMAAPQFPFAAGAVGRVDLLRTALIALTVLTVSRIHQHFGFMAVFRPALVLAGLALAYAWIKPSALSRLPWTRMWPARAIMALGIWACLSAPFGLSLGGSARMILDSYSKVLIFAFLVMATIRGVGDLRRYTWAYVASLGILVWMSLFVFGMQKMSDDGFYRLGDLYTYDANDIGVVMLSGVGLALVAFQTSRAGGKVLAGLILLGAGATIARTGSRGAFLGFIATFLALMVFGRSVSLVKRLAFVALTVLGLTLASPAGYWDQMRTAFRPTEDYNWTSSGGRKQLWSRGMGYMTSRPLFGLGIGQFPRAEGTLAQQAVEWDPRLPGIKWSAPHNSYVEAGAELGIPGLAIFLSLTLGGIVSLWRLRRRVPRAWASGDPDERFLYHATSYLPVSFVGFTTSAFFVSFAWVDPIYILSALLVGLHVCVAQRLTPGAMAPVAQPTVWMPRRRSFYALLVVALTAQGCGPGSVPPPAAAEPVFDGARDVSLFFDGFESYDSTASLTDGSGAYTYATAGSGLTGISLVSGGAIQGTKKLSFDYQAAGSYSRVLETFDLTIPGGGGPQVIVLSYQFRNVGNVHHEKQFILFKTSSGSGRWVMNVWGIVAPLDLATCYYSGGLYGTPRSPDIPPAGRAAPGWNSDPTGYQYQQNRGYLDFQLNNDINDGQWHRYTTRLERHRSGSGTGRVEGWVDGIKIIEYIGDDPGRCEYGKVFTAGSGAPLISGFQFPTTTSGAYTWDGGATLEYDAVRIWAAAP